MAEVLVLVDHIDGAPKKVSYELLTLARTLGEPSAVVLGKGAAAAAEKVAVYGAQKVYVCEADELDSFLVGPEGGGARPALVTEKSPLPSSLRPTPEGKEVAARVAVKTGGGLLTDAVGCHLRLDRRAADLRRLRRRQRARWRPARRSSQCAPTAPHPRGAWSRHGRAGHA